MKALPIIFLIWLFADLSTPPPSLPGLTRLVGTTENPEARKDFDRGLLLLHNFEYPDAAEMFRSAQQKDPNFALAYWGEAMTYNHPVWLSQDTDDARAVLDKYKQSKRSATRPLPSLDQDLMTSVEILYGDGTKAERDSEYAEYMATLYRKYAENQDVAAFYSLALLGKAAGWDEALCGQAAEVAGSILEENPKHPGALHYYIHAQDHPDFANNAWDVANRYATVASYSGHALHMPSHIYLALGVWDRVVTSNEISWQAGVDRKQSKNLTNNALNYHAHWWLDYGYLQQGRYSKAAERVHNQLAFTRALPSPSARTHFAFIRGHYLIETNDWDHELASETIKSQDLRIEIRNLERLIKGLTAFKQGDKYALNKLVDEAVKDISAAQQGTVINESVAQCSPNTAATGGSPGSAGLNMAKIMMEELSAVLAYMNGDFRKAEAHFHNAISIEEQNGHFFGPPEIMRPTQEFYGDFLLSRKKYKEAAAAFEKALDKAPGRTQSLIGLKTALQHLHDAEGAKRIASQLEKNLASAEVDKITTFFSTD